MRQQVETFTKDEFESAMPKGWHSWGFRDGEYVYWVPAQHNLCVMVRSSVDNSGFSRGTGEDSIRIWLADIDTGEWWGVKTFRWITRVRGWQVRLNKAIEDAIRKSGSAVKCYCKKRSALRRVQKQGPNEGRLFICCADRKCNYFQWVEDR